MTTTLEAYGYDSYPYLHVSRRMCVPYAEVLAYVEWLDQGGVPGLLHTVTEAAIERAYVQERNRRVMALGA